MAGPDSNDNIKEKVQSVREVVLGKSNNEIVLVLQYYDYNVEKAIQAYLEDGAKEALGEWHVPPAKSNKKKKNKKKAAPNAGPADNGASTPTGGAAAAAAAVPASVSLLPSQPPLSSAQPLPQRDPTTVSNGISSSSSSITETNNSSSSSSTKPLLSNGVVHSGSIKDREVPALPVEESAAATASPALTAAETPPSTNSSHPPGTVSTTTKQHVHRNHAGSLGHHGHNKSHGHNQRTRTTSERSTASSVGAGGDNHPKRPFQGLEKSIKDLQRQTTSLERLHLVLDHEIERSYKSVKTVFEEMRTHLNTREKEIMMEMDVVKQQAYEVFKMRQEQAATLKVHIERAEKMSESELVDLRADVKHFVADRKIDEELGKTTRFQYDSDHLKDEILHFGEVLPVKNNYTARSPSVSSVASSGPGVEEVPPPPSVSLHPDPLPVAAPSQEQETAQMSTEELADLQIRLQNSLKLQGLAEDRKSANGNDHSAAITEDSQQTKSARRRNRNRERREQHKTEEESMVTTSSPSGGSNSRAATPSSTHASAGSASPSPQRGQRSSPQRGGVYRGRGRGGGGGPSRGGYRGEHYQGRGSPRSRPYSAGRGGGGRGSGAGGGDYHNRQYGGGSRTVVVNGGSS
ncbi:spermatogenesis-associated serine-rich protein 2-like isoform X2 [Babylonia areolata]